MAAFLVVAVLAATIAAAPPSLGPLLKVPAGWSHHDGQCVHRACGTYTENTTGFVVSYEVAPPEEAAEACQFQSGCVPQNGIVGGTPYCSFEQPNARAQQLAELYRAHPGFKEHPEWLSDVSLSPEGSSFFFVAFVSTRAVWCFHADLCTEADRAALRRLLFEQISLATPE